MPRLYGFLVLIGGLVVAWLVIPRLYGLSKSQFWSATEEKTGKSTDLPAVPLPPAKAQKTFRLCVWDVTPLDRYKVGDPGIRQAIAAVIRQFDMTVLQGVDLQDRTVMTAVMDSVKNDSDFWTYITVPEPLRLSLTRGPVIIFDLTALEVDLSTLQIIEVVHRRFRIPPLTVAFRARGAPPERAFTFSLLAVHVDPFAATEELAYLGDVFRAVRDDGRGEDDLLMVGSFAVPEQELLVAMRTPDAACVNLGLPTSVTGLSPPVNIGYDARATIEYTGRHGVIDLMRQFRLTAAQVQQIAPHMPVWAEFSVYEGGAP